MNAYVLALRISCGNYLARDCRETRDNRGPCVDEIKLIYGDTVPLAEAWCAQYAYAMHRLACMRIRRPVMLPRTKGAWDMVIKSLGYIRVDGKPQPGDVFYRFAPYGSGHVGCVMEADASGILTIEGNVNNRVGARTYSMSDIRDSKKGFRFIHVGDFYGGSQLVFSRLEWY